MDYTSNNESKLLISRINDLLSNENRTSFLGFLNETEQSVAISQLMNSGKNYLLFGGFQDAERKIVCVYPEWANEEDIKFPLEAITFKYKSEYILSHRDFLGALLALGIRRQKVGDILVSDGKTVVFMHKDVVEYVFSQVLKIGKIGVELTKGFSLPLPNNFSLKPIQDVISSCRLDCVVSALCNLSRGKAQEIINSKRVSLNHLICESPSKNVVSDDILSIKGFGRFMISDLNQTTKKGKLILKANKRI